jgi:glycosyltransferase involved in cell wall biosynthesis
LKDRTDIVILMVGQGPLREHLREKARADGLTNVLFRDSPFQDMARLMAVTRASIATVADVPAARKMRLSKVIPPLACAVPVIYSGQGESATILTREGCGIVTAPGSPEDLARAIRRLADMPELCREMGERGRSLVEREYSWSSIVGNWLQELNNIKASTTIQESSARL